MAAMDPGNTGDHVLISRKVWEGLVHKLSGIHTRFQETDKALQYYQKYCAYLQSQLTNSKSQQSQQSPRHSVQSRHITGRASLSRTVSEPQRKTSNPEIFIFPEVKSKSIPRKSETLQSKSLSVDGGGDSVSESAVTGQDHTQAGHTTSNIFQYPTGQEGNYGTYEASSLEYTSSGLESPPGTPGVSEQYFNNVVNELLKTKRYLHELQTKQASRVESAAQTEAPSQQVAPLQLQHDQLHSGFTETCGSPNDSIELESTEEMLHGLHVSTQTDSLDHRPTQNDRPQRIQEQFEDVKIQNEHLKSSINLFTSLLQEEKARSKIDSEQLRRCTHDLNLRNSEMEQLKQTMKQTNVETEQLKQIVRLSSNETEQLKQTMKRKTEEVERYKQTVKQKTEAIEQFKRITIQRTEENEHLKQVIKQQNVDTGQMKQIMKQLNEEKNKLCEQLGHLRSQFEELQTEKNALEKERQLSLTESYPSGSQYHSTHSRVQSGLCDKLPTGKQSALCDKLPTWNQSQSDSLERLNFETVTHSESSERRRLSGSGFQDGFPLKLSPQTGENVLTSSPQAEKNILKFSPQAAETISPNQFRYSSSPSDGTNVLPWLHMSGSGVAETEGHPEMICPRCQQVFHVELSYLSHLQKCED